MTRNILRAPRATLAALALLCAATGVDATGITGKLLIVAIDKDIAGNLVFIKLDKPKASFPPCQINTAWDFVLPLNDAADKNMYAMLLTANATQQTIHARGRDVCPPEFGSIERLEGFRFTPAP
ncbi:hypothetical protein CDN99_06440 [Roseateles aquatilis]|uniref:Uncharacterized protein n=1 Tax=Roseateles aquatilis TaxID=431061 RepID=A0A246JH97_9BURK|nr:hypothetical protein [Roseateles aquatilis]OWQ91994.1 hypothetical protein CDN99_06440 [Roseateles aquatilis]